MEVKFGIGTRFFGGRILVFEVKIWNRDSIFNSNFGEWRGNSELVHILVGILEYEVEIRNQNSIFKGMLGD